ncbi:MAG: hypothetical protein IT562_16765 [Alphaproteobacteria bacterium]|nr:hypothetical protein [Alphaproteobacteria bacterium]
MQRDILPRRTWLGLAAALLLGGCIDETPERGSSLPPSKLTMLASANQSVVSFDEASVGGQAGPVTIGSTAAPQQSAQCSPDGRYIAGDAGFLQNAEQAVGQEIDQTKRTIDDLNSRIEQCKGKSKGLSEFDAQFGCNRASFRQMQGRLQQLDNLATASPQELAPAEWKAMVAVGERAHEITNRVRWSTNRIEAGLALVEFAQAEADWEKATKALNEAVDARKKTIETERRSVKTAVDQMAPLCEQAETAYEQNPCNAAQVASDAFARNRARDRLAALEARRTLLKDCRKDRERQAAAPSGMGSPAAQELLMQSLPGIMGGFRTRPAPRHPPPKDTSRQPDLPQKGGEGQPHWHDHKN